MKQYLLLRLRTQSRQMAEVGWWRALLLIVLLTAAVRQLLSLLAAHRVASVALCPLLMVLLLGTLHRRRDDMAFLQLVAPQYRRWLMAEYSILAALMGLPLLAYDLWLAAGLAIIVAPWVALLPGAGGSAARQQYSLVRSEVFEWVSGLRRRGGWWLWALLLAVAVWQRQLTLVPPACLIGWLLVVASFYDTPEPAEMLLTGARSPGQWLRRRTQWAWLYFLLTGAPFLFLMAASEAGWGGVALLLIWSMGTLTLVVLAKYTFYPHPATTRVAQGGVLALALLILVDQVYTALLLAVLVGLIWRSRYRLQAFRYD